VRGAIGAVVLADIRRLADSFPPVDFFEERGLPYIVALNCFDAELRHSMKDVREAMAVGAQVPIIRCDARDRESTKQTLITLVEYSVERWIALDGVPAHRAPVDREGMLTAGTAELNSRRP
jgi:signal recognition particle receptor subunit beta